MRLNFYCLTNNDEIILPFMGLFFLFFGLSWLYASDIMPSLSITLMCQERDMNMRGAPRLRLTWGTTIKILWLKLIIYFSDDGKEEGSFHI